MNAVLRAGLVPLGAYKLSHKLSLARSIRLKESFDEIIINDQDACIEAHLPDDG